jgi:2'-5' RNA ligase
MPECTRTFIAIAVPQPVEHELTRLQAELAPEIAGCHWTSTRPFHITLAFLGDVPNSDLNEICQTVTASSVSLDRFEVEVRDMGAFPNAGRPRVVWAGVTATNINALNELQQSVIGSLEHSRHDNQRVRALIDRWAGWSAGGFVVAEVLIMASTLGRSGPRYEVLSRAQLDGKKP